MCCPRFTLASCFYRCRLVATAVATVLAALLATTMEQAVTATTTAVVAAISIASAVARAVATATGVASAGRRNHDGRGRWDHFGVGFGPVFSAGDHFCHRTSASLADVFIRRDVIGHFAGVGNLLG